MPNSKLPTLLTIPEVATVARTTQSTVRHWIATGMLASRKPGRRRLIRRGDLATFLETLVVGRRRRDNA